MATRTNFRYDGSLREITGLSTDTKPTTFPAGSIFRELDTGFKFMYDGSTWYPLKEGAIQMREFYINTAASPTVLEDDIWYVASGQELAVRDKLTVEGKIIVKGKLVILKIH